jgi:hypothetical protein
MMRRLFICKILLPQLGDRDWGDYRLTDRARIIQIRTVFSQYLPRRGSPHPEQPHQLIEIRIPEERNALIETVNPRRVRLGQIHYQAEVTGPQTFTNVEISGENKTPGTSKSAQQAIPLDTERPHQCIAPLSGIPALRKLPFFFPSQSPMAELDSRTVSEKRTRALEVHAFD